MEVKLGKYLLVVIIALLFAMIFVTGVSLALIDSYVQPLPMEERFLVFQHLEAAPAVVAERAAPLPVALLAVEPAAVFENVPFSASSLGVFKGDSVNARRLKPSRLMGQVALGGNISQPGRYLAESSPTDMVMALPNVDRVARATVVTRPTQTAVPPEPLPTELPPTVAPPEAVDPTAAPPESTVPPTTAPSEATPTPTAEEPLEPTALPTLIPTTDIYVVRYGDSLVSIATSLGLTRAILMEVNGLTNQSVIHPGDQLKVPEITHIGVPHVGQIIWPVEARYIIKQYQYGHRAVDIVLPSGSPVVAIAAGTVEYAGWHQDGYGYMVYIDHGNGVTSLYAHNSALHVKSGDVVEQGQLITDSGNTGNSTMPHLHLEIQSSGHMLNPCLYLPDGC